MVFHGCHRKKSFFLFVGTDDKVDNVAFTKMERAVIFETKRVETIIFHYLRNLKMKLSSVVLRFFVRDRFPCKPIIY